jgi:hypothetical protein
MSHEYTSRMHSKERPVIHPKSLSLKFGFHDGSNKTSSYSLSFVNSSFLNITLFVFERLQRERVDY